MSKMLVLGVVISSLLPTYALGFSSHPDKHKSGSKKIEKLQHETYHIDKPDTEKETANVPEISASSAGLAIALVGGIVLVYKERRRRSAKM